MQTMDEANAVQEIEFTDKAKQLTQERKVLHNEETDTKAVSTGSEQRKHAGKWAH